MEDLEQLIQKAQKGDPQAFGTIYHLFYKRIYRYCYLHIADEETAADICQETFIKGWKAVPKFSFKKGGSFQAFLFQIARNLVIDHSRKKKEILIDETIEIVSKENIESILEKKNEEEKLHSALSKLDETDRHIIVLRYFEELSFQEVAQVVQMNEGALRVKTHRALKKLKGLLEKYG